MKYPIIEFLSKITKNTLERHIGTPSFNTNIYEHEYYINDNINSNYNEANEKIHNNKKSNNNKILTFGKFEKSDIISNLEPIKKENKNIQIHLNTYANKKNVKKSECETLTGMKDTISLFNLPKIINYGKDPKNFGKSLEKPKLQNKKFDTSNPKYKEKTSNKDSNNGNTFLKKENSIIIKNNSIMKGIVRLTSNKDNPFSINAIVQCLSNINRFRNYLIKEENYKDLLADKNKDKKVSFALAKVFKNIWENNETISKGVYDTSEFKKEIFENINELKNNTSPIVILNSILAKINKELETSNENNLPKINNVKSNYNENINYGMIEFNKNNSIIKEEFYGIQKFVNNCNKCQAVEVNLNPLYFLNFNFILEEISKIKDPIKIMDCFEYLERSKKNPDKNFFCLKCKKNRIPFFHKEFKILPKTIIISIDKKILKNEVKIIIEENLCLKNNKINYNLIAVITEIDSKHFIAYCKNYLDNKWHIYDDEKVEESSFSKINWKNIPSILFFSSDRVPKFK